MGRGGYSYSTNWSTLGRRAGVDGTMEDIQAEAGDCMGGVGDELGKNVGLVTACNRGCGV